MARGRGAKRPGSAHDPARMTPRGSFPAVCMDPTPLHAFIAELAASERFQAFTKALPGARPRLRRRAAARARDAARGARPRAAGPPPGGRGCARRGRGRVVVPRAASGSRSCRAAASRTRPGSSRRRTSSASGPGRSTSSPRGGSCARRQRRSPRACRRQTSGPQPLRLAVGDEPGLDGLAEALASAGYERVDRVEERGQFAVRGGIVDVFPSTGREPLRIELFGDEIEQVRAFSPFTQRALHAVTDATVYPAAERRRGADRPRGRARLGGGRSG